MQNKLKKFELYESRSQSSYMLIEEGDRNELDLLEEDAELIWSVEAATWDEACTKQHEYLGWEAYKPMDT